MTQQQSENTPNDSDESPGAEAQESDDEQVTEFADKFTIRRVDRSFVASGIVIVGIIYLNDRRPESPTVYEYYIPLDEYEYDKIKIARQIRQQHAERAKASGGTGGRKK